LKANISQKVGFAFFPGPPIATCTSHFAMPTHVLKLVYKFGRWSHTYTFIRMLMFVQSSSEILRNGARHRDRCGVCSTTKMAEMCMLQNGYKASSRTGKTSGIVSQAVHVAHYGRGHGLVSAASNAQTMPLHAAIQHRLVRAILRYCTAGPHTCDNIHKSECAVGHSTGRFNDSPASWRSSHFSASLTEGPTDQQSFRSFELFFFKTVKK